MRIQVMVSPADDPTIWEMVEVEIDDLHSLREALVLALGPTTQMEMAEKLGVPMTTIVGDVMAKAMALMAQIEEHHNPKEDE